MQDRPTADELLEAIEEFLREHSNKESDRFLRFQFLVASNSLAILRREWESEEPFLEAEWAGLGALLGAARRPGSLHAMRRAVAERNDLLCQDISDGAFDGEEAEARLLAHLLETTANKVRIATPAALQ
jgi:Domain of unknown function (DUF6285)